MRKLFLLLALVCLPALAQKNIYVGGGYANGGAEITEAGVGKFQTITSGALTIGGHIIPPADSLYDLGSATYYWRAAYIDTVNTNAVTGVAGGDLDLTPAASQKVVLSGQDGTDRLYVETTGIITVNSQLYPNADSSRNLGSPSLYWANAYIDAITTTGAITAGGNLDVKGGVIQNTAGTMVLRSSAGNALYIRSGALFHFQDMSNTPRVYMNSTDGDFYPAVDSTSDLGSSSFYWRNAYIDQIYTSGVEVNGDVTLINDGTLEIQNASAEVIYNFGQLGGVAFAVFGTSDTNQGLVALYGNDTTLGSKLSMKNAAGEDTNVDGFLIEADGEDLLFGSENDASILIVSDATSGAGDESVTVDGDLTATGAFFPRQVNDAGPMTATAGTEGEIVYNTSDNKFYGCTATGSPATWAAFH